MMFSKGDVQKVEKLKAEKVTVTIHVYHIVSDLCEHEELKFGLLLAIATYLLLWCLQ